MAKRKRLSPPTGLAEVPGGPAGGREGSLGPVVAPIAQMAGDSAAASAFEEVSAELIRAREEGRLIREIPLADIDAGHLLRDRLSLDPEELEALKSSIRSHGQRTPVDVELLQGGRFGLISGWRRLTALQQLHNETGEDHFALVRAAVRPLAERPSAYVAMVEENEIRTGLSFYERARIAGRAAAQGVFPSDRDAVKALFAAVPRSRRSKINSFLTLYGHLDGHLRHPQAISEKLGLALVRLFSDDSGAVAGVIAGLTGLPDNASASDELAVLAAAIRPRSDPKTTPEGVEVHRRGGKLVIEGQGADDAFERDLRAWIASRA